jgi:hypothetical protein
MPLGVIPSQSAEFELLAETELVLYKHP